MIYRVVLSPDANEGIRSALLWYVQHDIDLPFRFTGDLEATLNRSAQNPYQFPPFEVRLRRTRMKRFPYLIYFTVFETTVYVIAISHERRLSPLSRP